MYTGGYIPHSHGSLMLSRYDLLLSFTFTIPGILLLQNQKYSNYHSHQGQPELSLIYDFDTGNVYWYVFQPHIRLSKLLCSFRAVIYA